MISTAAARTAYSKLELWDFNASSDLPESVSFYLQLPSEKKLGLSAFVP